MEYKIVWTNRATSDVEHTLWYLQNEWTEKIAFDYFEKLISVVSLIKSFSYSFPLLISEKRIRRCPVTKHNMIYFRIEGTEIFILTVFDTRRNPGNLDL